MLEFAQKNKYAEQWVQWVYSVVSLLKWFANRCYCCCCYYYLLWYFLLLFQHQFSFSYECVRITTEMFIHAFVTVHHNRILNFYFFFLTISSEMFDLINVHWVTWCRQWMPFIYKSTDLLFLWYFCYLVTYN